MISLVLATYNRGHYLERSLVGYAQHELSEPLELVIVDDGSTDDTADLVDRWSRYLNIVYIRLWKRAGLWRDAACVINRGLRAASGALIIGTHPEVIPGRKSLQALWDARAERTYLACKIYYLSPADQEQIDTVEWRSRGNLAMRDLPNFYQEESVEVTGNSDYSHEATDRHAVWESWVFGGLTRATWQWQGGFTEFPTWGSGDVDWLARRRILGIGNYTAREPETICVHQNHDVPGRATDVPTPRDMEACMAALSPYHTPEEARKPW